MGRMKTGFKASLGEYDKLLRTAILCYRYGGLVATKTYIRTYRRMLSEEPFCSENPRKGQTSVLHTMIGLVEKMTVPGLRGQGHTPNFVESRIRELMKEAETWVTDQKH